MFNNKHIIGVLFLCFVIVVGNFSATVQAQPSSTGGKLLTNESIISLVKTGLSDTAIISLIQKSPTQFDLSPESLVRLKGAGVSNSVIEAMIGSQSLPANSEKASLIPTAYGFYVVDEGQLRELKPSPVITKIGLQPGGPRSRLAGSAMDGFAGEPPFSIASQAPIFIVYQQNVNPNDFHLANLVYVSTKQAGQFNYFGTNPMFFRNLYGVNESDIIRIDLWRPKAQIPLRIEPVEGKTGMFRLIPNSPLKPDKYTLYLKDAIHLDGTIFISETDRQSSAFYFKVE